MANIVGDSTLHNVAIRQIIVADVPAAVTLLTRGYGTDRTREFWEHIFACLSDRPVPAGFPRYGYAIESDGNLVGIMLLIFSTVWEGDEPKVRCNGFGVYVDPAFRLYASLLTNRALRYKGVTVSNLTSAKHTHRMIELTGFVRYSNGIFFAIPLLSRASKDIPVRVIDAHTQPDVPFDLHEHDLLLEHADYGCKSLWCVTPERAYPFVFRTRRVKFVSCAQLVYCRHLDDFVRFARPIGSFLARSTARLLVLLDANAPVPGLVGKYFAGKTPRYFFGPDRPRLGDLAYTEVSMFGI
jgi:hypothetical protein